MQPFISTPREQTATRTFGAGPAIKTPARRFTPTQSTMRFFAVFRFVIWSQKSLHLQVAFAHICTQDWGLVCAVIEIVIELIVLLIYGVVAYRFWTKRRLMKTMDGRDKARSDLYLAQLRMQSAPNTPGFPQGGYASYPAKNPYVVSVDPLSSAEKGQAEPTTTQYASPRSPTRPISSFQLQPPPSRNQPSTPQSQQGGFVAISAPRSTSPPAQSEAQHLPAAPGETNYGAVPIPGAYTSPMMPTFPPAVHQ